MKIFIANGIFKIEVLTQTQDWRHVPTLDNPADIISRGQNSQEFLENITSTQGPLWLSQNSGTWPQLCFHMQEVLDTKNPTTVWVLIALHENKTENEILTKFSGFKKLTVIVGHCLKFINKTKNKDKCFKRMGEISTEEYKDVFEKIINLMQAAAFPREYHALSH